MGGSSSSSSSDFSFGISKTKLAEMSSAHSEGGAQMLKKMGGVEGLMKLLKTSKDGGITSKSEDARRAVFGTNKPELEYPPSFLEELWETFQDVVIIALCICAVISLALGIYEASEEGGAPYIEGIAIIVSVCVVCFVGAYTNWSKNQLYFAQKLKNSISSITVVRDGTQINAGKGNDDLEGCVTTDEVVVGDVIFFKTGTIACADCVVIEANGLMMDESALTGESDHCKKDPVQKPFILAGTKCAKGNGYFLVIAVGENSQSGVIKKNIESRTENVPFEGVTAMVVSGESSAQLDNCNKLQFAEIQEQIKEGTKFKLDDQEGLVLTQVTRNQDGLVRIEFEAPFQGTTTKVGHLFYEEKMSKNTKSILAVKLEKMAFQIGQFGLVMAVITVLMILMRWSIESFAIDKRDWYSEIHCEVKNFPDSLREHCNDLIPITRASGSNYTCVHPKFSTNSLVCRTYEIEIVKLKDCKTLINEQTPQCTDGAGTSPCVDFDFKVGDHGHCRVKEAADANGNESGFKYHEIVDDFKALLNAFITGITVLVVAVRFVFFESWETFSLSLSLSLSLSHNNNKPTTLLKNRYQRDCHSL